MKKIVIDYLNSCGEKKTAEINEWGVVHVESWKHKDNDIFEILCLKRFTTEPSPFNGGIDESITGYITSDQVKMLKEYFKDHIETEETEICI